MTEWRSKQIGPSTYMKIAFKPCFRLAASGIYWNGKTGWVGPQGWWVSLAGSHLSQEEFLGPADKKVGLESTCQEACRRELWRRGKGIGIRGTTGEPTIWAMDGALTGTC